MILFAAVQSLHVDVRCHSFPVTSYQIGRLLLPGPNFRVSRYSAALPARECQRWLESKRKDIRKDAVRFRTARSFWMRALLFGIFEPVFECMFISYSPEFHLFVCLLSLTRCVLLVRLKGFHSFISVCLVVLELGTCGPTDISMLSFSCSLRKENMSSKLNAVSCPPDKEIPGFCRTSSLVCEIWSFYSDGAVD